MGSTNEEAARALSSHRFAEAFPFIASDVVWDVVGAGVVTGRDDAIAACETLEAELLGTTVVFERLRSLVAGDSVIVDSIATYQDPAGDTSKVAACDIYDFRHAQIVAIRSFNVELEAAI